MDVGSLSARFLLAALCRSHRCELGFRVDGFRVRGLGVLGLGLVEGFRFRGLRFEGTSWGSFSGFMVCLSTGLYNVLVQWP